MQQHSTRTTSTNISTILIIVTMIIAVNEGFTYGRTHAFAGEEAQMTCEAQKFTSCKWDNQHLRCTYTKDKPNQRETT